MDLQHVRFLGQFHLDHDQAKGCDFLHIDIKIAERLEIIATTEKESAKYGGWIDYTVRNLSNDRDRRSAISMSVYGWQCNRYAPAAKVLLPKRLYEQLYPPADTESTIPTLTRRQSYYLRPEECRAIVSDLLYLPWRPPPLSQ